MTSMELRGIWDAHPFRPFTIRMTDGRSFRVPHRDYVSISPTGRIFIVYGNDGALSILDMLLATELEVDTPAPETNGASAQA